MKKFLNSIILILTFAITIISINTISYAKYKIEYTINAAEIKISV